jgi:hypothetical protein
MNTKASPAPFQHAVGDVVVFRARPYDPPHEVTIVALLRAGDDPWKVYPPFKDLKGAQWDFNPIGGYPRYLVEEKRFAKKGGAPLPSRYFAPRASAVDEQNPKEAP